MLLVWLMMDVSVDVGAIAGDFRGGADDGIGVGMAVSRWCTAGSARGFMLVRMVECGQGAHVRVGGGAGMAVGPSLCVIEGVNVRVGVDVHVGDGVQPGLLACLGVRAVVGAGTGIRSGVPLGWAGGVGVAVDLCTGFGVGMVVNCEADGVGLGVSVVLWRGSDVVGGVK